MEDRTLRDQVFNHLINVGVMVITRWCIDG